MRRIGWALLLIFALASTALGEGMEITYQDYGVKFTAAADAEYIDLGKVKVSNFDVFERFLDQLPSLQRVDMYTTHMHKKEADRLSARYPQIEFGWTLYFGDHRARTDQTVFSTRHDSIVKRHDSKTMDVLRYCRSLRALDLGHNDLTDVSFLAELKDLRLLILADNRIEDLSPLSDLQNLEYIELFNNRVTSLEPLSGLEHLLDLNIAQNRVTSLEPLMKMPWLKRLWMRTCDYDKGVLTAPALEALQAALPNTQIDAVSLGTDGGWRSHPHYDVLFNMFKTEEYTPFEDSFSDEETL